MEDTPPMSSKTVAFDLSQVLNYPITVRINGWHSEQPLHWASFNDDGLVAEGLFLEAPGLPLFTLSDDNGLRLCDSIPDDVNAICRLMPAMDFQLAQACAVSQPARELAREVPLLLLLAVDYASQQPLPVAEFEQLLARKRADILSAAGLAGSKSLARLVGRIKLSPMMPWELDDVCRALNEPDFLTLLRHHPELHLNHLRLLLRVRRPLWPGLLYLVSEHTQAADLTWTCRMIRDTLNLAGGNEQVFAQVNSRETLQDQHDRFIGLFNRQNHRNSAEKRLELAQILQKEHGDYPKPPIAPITGIEPLTSWLELLEEGATMRHCVGSYDVPVARGQTFIYRMTSPERLTVSLERHNNTWVVGEVRGSCNANPSPAALEQVRRWVNL